MKRILALLLAILMLAALLCACGKKEKKSSKNESSNPSSTVSSHVTTPSSVPTPEPVKTAKAAKVSADGGLNIRSEPSTDAEVLGVAEDGSLLPLLKEKADDGWYEVEYEGKTGYIYAEYAKPQDVTLAEYNRLRSGGNTDSSASSEESSSSSDETQSTTSSSSSSKSSTSNEDGE